MLRSPLYRDEYLFVINKPPGINVHPGDHKTAERSIIEGVHDFLGNTYDSLTFRPALIHRIDRDTSGCLMVALQKVALEWMLKQMQSHEIEKTYHALVFGAMPQSSGTIRDPLLRVNGIRWIAKVRVSPEGQRAVTHYRVLQTWHTDVTSLSLIACRIETGRTHQIRVHLSHYDCPIVWDHLYGNRSLNSYFARHMDVHRQMLHSFRLSFLHPRTGQRVSLEAPYYPDMLKILSYEIST